MAVTGLIFPPVLRRTVWRLSCYKEVGSGTPLELRIFPHSRETLSYAQGGAWISAPAAVADPAGVPSATAPPPRRPSLAASLWGPGRQDFIPGAGRRRASERGASCRDDAFVRLRRARESCWGCGFPEKRNSHETIAQQNQSGRVEFAHKGQNSEISLAACLPPPPAWLGPAGCRGYVVRHRRTLTR